jgi:uncharacterized protein YjcR
MSTIPMSLAIERHQQMYALYLTGYTSKEVAQHYGVTHQRICAIFKRNGWPMRKQGQRPKKS